MTIRLRADDDEPDASRPRGRGLLRPRTLALALALALPGCRTLPSSTATAVAVDDARIYVIGGGALWSLGDGGPSLTPRRPIDLPCADPIDVEIHAGALTLLCGDGRVFARQARDPASAWLERTPAPPGGAVATGLQRADQTLYRVERSDPPVTSDPPGSIRLDGPGPTYSPRAIADRRGEPVEGRSADHWHSSEAEGPITSNADGSALLFTARLFRRVELSLSAAGQPNVRCRLRGEAALDVAIDDSGRIFVALLDDVLVVIRLTDAGSVRARAYAPRTGERRRGHIACRR